MNHFIVYILGIIDRFFNLQHVKFMAEAMEKFKNGVVDPIVFGGFARNYVLRPMDLLIVGV